MQRQEFMSEALALISWLPSIISSGSTIGTRLHSCKQRSKLYRCLDARSQPLWQCTDEHLPTMQGACALGRPEAMQQ